MKSTLDPSEAMPVGSGWRRLGRCFHFDFQPSVNQEHLPSPNYERSWPNRLFGVTVGEAGSNNRGTENPRVGGSNRPLATISINLLANCRDSLFGGDFPQRGRGYVATSQRSPTRVVSTCDAHQTLERRDSVVAT
jgi:hypothetical protein